MARADRRREHGRVTAEATFYRRFVADVRCCADGHAPAAVAEIERRVRLALIAPPSLRERRWARVVAAVAELLAGLCGGAAGTAQAGRLRAFVRENGGLGRPRDVAISDFRFVRRDASLLTDARGRSYLVFAPQARPRSLPPRGALDEVVPGATRRLAEWAVYGLCGGAVAGALWFTFIVPG